MAATDVFARRATLSRSVRLLSQFRFEQTDPARFYGALADDTVAMVGDLWLATHRETAAGRTAARRRRRSRLLRRRRSQDAGFDYIGVEPDPAEMHAGPATGAGRPPSSAPPGMALPFADASVDICLSSNVAEHVREPWRLGPRDAARHQARRAGGAVLHGVARPVRRPRDGVDALPRRCARRGALHPQARPRPKNDYGSSLFAVSAADGLDLARAPARWSPHFPATTRDGPGG